MTRTKHKRRIPRSNVMGTLNVLKKDKSQAQSVISEIKLRN